MTHDEKGRSVWPGQCVDCNGDKDLYRKRCPACNKIHVEGMKQAKKAKRTAYLRARTIEIK